MNLFIIKDDQIENPNNVYNNTQVFINDEGNLQVAFELIVRLGNRAINSVQFLNAPYITSFKKCSKREVIQNILNGQNVFRVSLNDETCCIEKAICLNDSGVDFEEFVLSHKEANRYYANKIPYTIK